MAAELFNEDETMNGNKELIYELLGKNKLNGNFVPRLLILDSYLS
jgi:hypothetical protein